MYYVGASLPVEGLGGMHPGPDRGNQQAAQQDLDRVINKKWDGYDRHLRVTFKHDLQDGDTWHIENSIQ